MNNPNTPDVSENPPPNIKREIVNLYDSYREFQHFCAFYCQSTGVMLRRFGEDLDADCIEGIERFAQMVIDKSDEVGAGLKQLMHRF
jgi:hypothetical protein